MKIIDNNIIDQRMLGRTIIRIGTYLGAKIKIEWLCLICNKKFWATPNSVIHSNNNCPLCKIINKTFTNEDIDNKLILDGRIDIIRVGNYTNMKTKLEWLCLLCDQLFSAIPNHIINRGDGCPICADTTLSNEIIDEILFKNNRAIIRIDNYINMKTKIGWKCLKCNNLFISTPDSVIHGDSGCYKCFNKSQKYSNIIIDKLLIQNNIINIKRVSDYTNSKLKLKWECLICKNYFWAKSPFITSGRYGCPFCKNKNEQIISTILIEKEIVFDYHYNIQNINISFPLFFIDFYIEHKNIFIEYNGLQHYEPVRFGGISKEEANIKFIKQANRDKILEQLCRDNNINLIWIDGRIYHNNLLEQYLKQEIIPIING